jgi:hypothetical protein
MDGGVVLRTRPKKDHDPHLEPVSWRSEFEVPYCFEVKFRTPRPIGQDRLEALRAALAVLQTGWDE